jgi:para-aminobenzoate synthetase component 1
LLYFAKRFSNFCFLDNHDYDFNKSYECLAGFGISKSITAREESGLQELDVFREENKDWIFGHVAYDLKNNFEALSSENADEIGFPDFQFFVPEIVITLSKYKVEIGILPGIDGASIFKEIISIVPDEKYATKVSLKKRFSKGEYLETVKKLQQHILRGDCYEICFCQEVYAKNVQIDPLKIFMKLSELSPNPFSSFYRSGEKYLMCASPERFLKKTNNTIISQPVKGTSRRDNMEVEDENEKMLLQQSEKERAENTMIVDLVRNDLSKICTEGSVSVKEFLKIYSFPQVHQMISTIRGSLRENISFSEILSATFPMGSMTGAPKKRAMELIEQYEKTKRGLFSGTVGYINPSGDFDFNVVIRSVLYNKEKKYISTQVGSAITWKSIPEKEYEECMIKAEAMMKALE